MKNFAVKIHYDNRPHLPPYLKYSQVATVREYAVKLSKGESGKGGKGFHECLNFAIEDDVSRFYLPPTYVPGEKSVSNEPVNIVWITYKTEQEYPSSIIGIHRNATLVTSKYESGLPRTDFQLTFNNSELMYHGQASESDTILFSEPMRLIPGRHIPRFVKWGNGLRYITDEHLSNIIQDRISLLADKMSLSIYEKTELDHLVNNRGGRGGKGKVPDKDLGILGEKMVFDIEIEYARANGIDERLVEHTSLRIPSGPYDIQTIRIVDGVPIVHYLEVKTTRTMHDPNIHISSIQITFAETNEANHDFVLVDITTEEVKYVSLSSLRKDFDLVTSHFRLFNKAEVK